LKRRIIILLVLCFLLTYSPIKTEVKSESKNIELEVIYSSEKEYSILSRGTPDLVATPIPTPTPSPSPTPMPTAIPTVTPTPIPTPTPTPLPAYSNNDLDELARIIFFEARGLSNDGKLAVGQIIINRADEYHKTIYDTIHSKEPDGSAVFSPTTMKNYYQTKYSEDCLNIARTLLEGNRYKPVKNALYFCTVSSYNNHNWHYQYVSSGKGKIILESENHIYIR
jgi:spore germination cell wall hydrolase CwlJ-like protein